MRCLVIYSKGAFHVLLRFPTISSHATIATDQFKLNSGQPRAMIFADIQTGSRSLTIRSSSRRRFQLPASRFPLIVSRLPNIVSRFNLAGRDIGNDSPTHCNHRVGKESIFYWRPTAWRGHPAQAKLDASLKRSNPQK